MRQLAGQARQLSELEERKYPKAHEEQVTKSEQVLQLVKHPAQMVESRK
jgi:hypothetical protein